VSAVLLSSSVLLAGALGCDEAPKKEEKLEPPVRKAQSLSSYQETCDRGTAFGGAKKYEKKPGKPSQMVVFYKYGDDDGAQFGLAAPVDRSALGAIHASPQPGDAGHEQVELVACVEAKKKKVANYCHYHGGKLELWDMSYQVRILEAKTGKELATEQFDLQANTKMCPGEKERGDHYQGPDYGPKLLEVVLPLQGKGQELPKYDADELDDVCAGIPYPQAPAYDKSEGAKRGVHVAYRPTPELPFTLKTRPKGLPRRGADEGDPAKIQLVACVTGKPEKKTKDCEFTGGKVLELYDGQLEFSVREAATAKVVETKTFPATSNGCPLDHRFYNQRDKYLAEADKSARDYLAKLAGGS
jgi:hypothetical protein